jgi:hypothetical protein
MGDHWEVEAGGELGLVDALKNINENERFL